VIEMVMVEVIGVEPPCKRCAITKKNAEEAVVELKKEGDSGYQTLDIASKETVSKFGIILSPAVAVNGKVRVAGRIPNTDEIVKIIKESL